MNDPQALRKLLKSNISIPTLPVIVQKITSMIGDPETGTREIGTLVGEDAPLAAKVLRIANSSYYGLASKCLSTEQASSVLGLKVLKNIVTQVSVISQFKNIQEETGFDVSQIWDHTGLTAQIASAMSPICHNIRVLCVDESYICGLLHKVGKVILLDHIGKPYASMLKEASNYPDEYFVLGQENKTLGFNHQDVGALVAKRWGLPVSVVDAIQLHGAPIAELGPKLHVHLITIASRTAALFLKGDTDGANRTLQLDALALGLDREAAMDLLEKVSL